MNRIIHGCGIQLALCFSFFVGTPSASAEVSKTNSKVITLKAGTWADVRKFIGASKGKIVVVDFWSTSCLPCKKEFPNLVKLDRDYPDDVVCVGVNLDYAGIRSKPPEYYRPRVEKFLKEQEASFRNYLSTTEAFEFLEQIDVASMPAVFVYDGAGKLAKRFDSSLLEEGEDEPFTYADDINPFITSLLKNSAR